MSLKDLRLIICDIDSVKSIKKELWAKFLASLAENQHGRVPRLLMTGYKIESPLSDDLVGEVVFNVVVKPFDALVLKQNILFALKDDSALETEALYSQQTSAKVEIVKEIEVNRLTELGFRTRSTVPIEKNKVARYFGEPFKFPAGDSLFARCTGSEKAPNGEGYNSSFSYFAPPTEQVSSIRRRIIGTPSKFSLPFETNAAARAQVFVFSRNRKLVENVRSVIDDKFEGHRLTHLSSYFEYITEMLPADQLKNHGLVEFPFFGTSTKPPSKLNANSAAAL